MRLGRWQIHEKETIDAIIFRTTNVGNRLLLELMAQGGMRVGAVLKLHAVDVDDQKFTIRSPKSGKSSEAVFIPKKLTDRLKDSTTPGFLGKVSDVEAVRWIENLYG